MSCTTQQPALPFIDHAQLTDLVGCALRREDAEVISSAVHELHSGGPGTTVYRLSGMAQAGARAAPWSLVLKTFTYERAGIKAAAADPIAWDYWKREWLAYQAPWLQNLRGSFVPPRCLGSAEHGNSLAWVALEDLTALDDRPWPLARFETVAHHLGRFNGAYVMGRPMPTDPWLSRGWLRGWTERAAPLVEQLPSVADHPEMRRLLLAPADYRPAPLLAATQGVLRRAGCLAAHPVPRGSLSAQCLRAAVRARHTDGGDRLGLLRAGRAGRRPGAAGRRRTGVFRSRSSHRRRAGSAVLARISQRARHGRLAGRHERRCALDTWPP